MDFGPHAGFIFFSYLICAATVLGLIAWVKLDRASLDRQLKELADQGISRNRSGDKDGSAA